MGFNVKEIFRTIQGEGGNAGTAAIFIRFGGCNLWTGHEVDRKRDAERHSAHCPRWCDTDFINGDVLTQSQIINTVRECGGLKIPLIVLTGGEPLLQVTPLLLQGLKTGSRLARIAVETNGTKRPKDETLKMLDWITVSPKTECKDVILIEGDELKVVYPAYNPKDYESLMGGFKLCYVSPQATPGRRSVIIEDNVQRAAQFVMEYPRWKLSLQTHKIIGLP